MRTVVFAAVVQSSSAAMMVTLAALHTGVIELPAAAAIAIGADLGTTTTVLIGAVKGGAGKKRVALAHVIFNVTTAVLAFGLLMPLLGVVSAVGIRDPLFSLVAFHSLFNFLGIVIFLPVMRPFANFLGRRFEVIAKDESLFVNETSRHRYRCCDRCDNGRNIAYHQSRDPPEHACIYTAFADAPRATTD